MKAELREVEQFLQSLNAAWKNLGLYSPSHPAAAAAFQRLGDALERLVGGEERITLGLVHNTLIFDGVPLMAKPELSRNLIERLQSGKIEGVTFLRGCAVEELRHFVEALGEDVKGVDLGQDLQKRGVSHILVVQEGSEETQQTEEMVVDRVGAGAIYSRALQTTRQMFQEARLGKMPSLSEVQRVVEDVVSGILKGKHSLMALTIIKSYDQYLFNHSVNVGILSMALGESLGLDGTSLRELGLGALLHDLGKVHIPEAVTRKPRDLTGEEWELIRRHPVEGVRMLEQMGIRSEIALSVVKEHHVRFDRTGYPTLAPEEDVHPYSMIVTICDAYDAMTTVRSYQRAFEPSAAVARMKTLARSVFDPEMLDRFVEMLGIYPPGTVVRLTTGEIGVVTRPGTEDVSRPWVRIIQDREGNPVDGEEVNLMEWDPEAEDYTRSILVTVDPALRGIDVARILQEEGVTQKG
ncbi:MAG: HD-GYP domain-containing protein [Candidatus Methylomirabilales bacterium]